MPQKPINERETEFGETLRQFKTIYDRQMLIDFFFYWTEPNKTLTKLKFEMEKTWDISRRLARWHRNNKNWNNGGTTHQQPSGGSIKKLGTSDARVDAVSKW